MCNRYSFLASLFDGAARLWATVPGGHYLASKATASWFATAQSSPPLLLAFTARRSCEPWPLLLLLGVITHVPVPNPGSSRMYVKTWMRPPLPPGSPHLPGPTPPAGMAAVVYDSTLPPCYQEFQCTA